MRRQVADVSVRSRTIGIVYFAYFLTAIGGEVLQRASAPVGMAVELLSTLIYAYLATMFYRLFAGVSQLVAVASLIAALTGCLVQAYAIAAGVPTASQMALVFFGGFCVLLGYLIAKSEYVPIIFGTLLMIAGFNWIALVVPEIAARYTGAAEIFGFLAELSLMLWLLVRGVTVAPAQ